MKAAESFGQDSGKRAQTLLRNRRLDRGCEIKAGRQHGMGVAEKRVIGSVILPAHGHQHLNGGLGEIGHGHLGRPVLGSKRPRPPDSIIRIGPQFGFEAGIIAGPGQRRGHRDQFGEGLLQILTGGNRRDRQIDGIGNLRHGPGDEAAIAAIGHMNRGLGGANSLGHILLRDLKQPAASDRPPEITRNRKVEFIGGNRRKLRLILIGEVDGVLGVMDIGITGPEIQAEQIDVAKSQRQGAMHGGIARSRNRQ